jgi:crotonobetainyl-CoA:carnitine CoA-transferase CaiB-like acyl-CoA transferase
MILELRSKMADKKAAIGVPVKLSETPGSVRSAAVEFGESTGAILKELGYTEEEITFLAKEDVI